MKTTVVLLCVALLGWGITKSIRHFWKLLRPVVVQEITPNKSWQEIGVIRWIHILPGGGTIYSYSAPMTMGEAHRLMWSPDQNGAKGLFFPKDTPCNSPRPSESAQVRNKLA